MSENRLSSARGVKALNGIGEFTMDIKDLNKIMDYATELAWYGKVISGLPAVLQAAKEVPAEVAALTAEADRLRKDVEKIRASVPPVQAEVKAEIDAYRAEAAKVRSETEEEMAGLRKKLAGLKKSLEDLEAEEKAATLKLEETKKALAELKGIL